MQWVTTTIVLEQLAREEAGAWELFVRRFRQPVIRFARDLGLSEDEAEDVVQETLASFLRAYRNGRYDRDKGRLSSWLFGIAHRTAMKIRSKAARRQRLAPAGDRTGFWDDLPDKDRTFLLDSATNARRALRQGEYAKAWSLLSAPRFWALRLQLGGGAVHIND